MSKECLSCERRFSWYDYGSEQKYNRMVVCPDCYHEMDVANEEAAQDIVDGQAPRTTGKGMPCLHQHQELSDGPYRVCKDCGVELPY